MGYSARRLDIIITINTPEHNSQSQYEHDSATVIRQQHQHHRCRDHRSHSITGDDLRCHSQIVPTQGRQEGPS